MNQEDKIDLNLVIQHYTTQLNSDPKNPVLYIFRSACYESLQDYKSALIDAIKAYKLDKFYWKARHQAIKLHIANGNIQSAETLLQISDNSDDCFKELIEKFRELKELDKRVKQDDANKLDLLQKAIEISPGSKKYEKLYFDWVERSEGHTSRYKPDRSRNRQYQRNLNSHDDNPRRLNHCQYEADALDHQGWLGKVLDKLFR